MGTVRISSPSQYQAPTDWANHEEPQDVATLLPAKSHTADTHYLLLSFFPCIIIDWKSLSTETTTANNPGILKVAALSNSTI